eukprot:2149286-Amphidinium_carterae.1
MSGPGKGFRPSPGRPDLCLCETGAARLGGGTQQHLEPTNPSQNALPTSCAGIRTLDRLSQSPMAVW